MLHANLVQHDCACNGTDMFEHDCACRHVKPTAKVGHKLHYQVPMPTILFAGTSPSVLGDILGTYEELRWMELHMASPSPCMQTCKGLTPLDHRVAHTHMLPVWGVACFLACWLEGSQDNAAAPSQPPSLFFMVSWKVSRTTPQPLHNCHLHPALFRPSK